jgi:hypothetical protein
MVNHHYIILLFIISIIIDSRHVMSKFDMIYFVNLILGLGYANFD